MYEGQYKCDLEAAIPKRRSKAYLPSQISIITPVLGAVRDVAYFAVQTVPVEA